MTFDQIKIAVGKNIKYYTDAGGWLTDRDVTEADIGTMVNDTYRDEIVPAFMTQYPYYFRHVAHANSWIATGTVSATSTGTTLVASSGIFANSMVGLVVVNSTDDESAIIESYTNTTTVTLDTTIGDTWDGDTIYVLGQEFVIGGDASDMYVVEAVGVKYRDTDQYFVLSGNPRPKFDIYQQGSEIFNKAAPVLYVTNSKTSSGGYADTIGILPAFDQVVTNAIELNYIAMPPVLSGDNDVPRLPVSWELVYGATAKAFRQKQEFDKAQQYEAMYQVGTRAAISRFRPTSTGFARQQRMPRRFSVQHRRLI